MFEKKGSLYELSHPPPQSVTRHWYRGTSDLLTLGIRFLMKTKITICQRHKNKSLLPDCDTTDF